MQITNGTKWRKLELATLNEKLVASGVKSDRSKIGGSLKARSTKNSIGRLEHSYN